MAAAAAAAAAVGERREHWRKRDGASNGRASAILFDEKPSLAEQRKQWVWVGGRADGGGRSCHGIPFASRACTRYTLAMNRQIPFYHDMLFIYTHILDHVAAASRLRV